ncbi:MAG: hypothetical protein WCS21_11210 [Lachnospiraceae bacterium]
MKISITSFAGERPGVDPKKLPAGVATSAINCRFERESLCPAKGPLTIKEVSGTGLSAVHRAGDVWQTFSSKRDVARGPVSTVEHYVMTGPDITPCQFDPEMAENGETLPLGLPAPEEPLTVEIVGDAGDDVTDTVSYVYTYVNSWGQEGRQSDPTGVIDLSGQTVKLTGFTYPEGYDIVSYRLYRFNSSDSTAGYQFLPWSDDTDDMPVSATYYEDDTPGSDLGATLGTSEYYEPPDDLQGIVAISTSVFAGFTGKEVWFSELYLPNAWPVSYMRTVDADVVAIAPYPSGCIALTTDKAVIFTGVDPASMSQEKVNIEAACVSKESVAPFLNGVIYASRQGLVRLPPKDNMGYDTDPVITRSIWDYESWNELDLENLSACFWKGEYVGWFIGSSKGMAVNFVTNTVRWFNLGTAVVRAMWHDTEEDTMALLLEDDGTSYIAAWEEGDDMKLTWSSGEAYIPAGTNPGAVRVNGEQDADSPVTFSLESDGETQELSITNDEPCRLSSGRKPKSHIMTVSGLSMVSEISIGSSIEEVM